MINFRTKADAGASIAILIALAVIVGTALVMLLIPPPSTAGIASGKIRSQRELDEGLDKLKANKIIAATYIQNQVWKVPIAEVGPGALEAITALAQQNRLKLIAFRPQKAVEVNELTQLPFVISIEGSYPNVLNFVRALEKPELKLGISMVQISTSDPNSDLVAATVGIVAYRQIEKPKTTKTSNAAKKEN